MAAFETWKRLEQVYILAETAWRRYRHVSSSSPPTQPELEDLDADSFKSQFETLLRSQQVSSSIAEFHFLTLPANRIPWTATGVHVASGREVTVFASGRVWASRPLHIYLEPQMALWYKIGNSGRIFNSSGNSITFESHSDGELYLANQYPGMFSDPVGGRVVADLSAYKKAEGKFEILIIQWREAVRAQTLLTDALSPKHPIQLDECRRLKREAETRLPADWSYLWFLGASTIYSSTTHEGSPCIHCKPYGNTGIIQKSLSPPLAFTPSTKVSWSWLLTAIPSRLREDTSLSHDYLSIAFEFENGRDITYTWSWELPVEHGYWCPFPTWEDREYHIVVRSGTRDLGAWLREERNLFEDYAKFVQQGEKGGVNMPMQVTKVWLIAGNTLQKLEGEMLVKQVTIQGQDATAISLL